MNIVLLKFTFLNVRFYKTTQQACKHVTWEQVSYHLINDPDMMCGNQFAVEYADFVEVIFL